MKPIQDDGTADAGAKSDHRHVIGIACGPEPFFAKSSDVGVVVEKHACTQAAFDFVTHGIIAPPGKVGGLTHHAGLYVDDPRNADAGTEEAANTAISLRQMENRVAHLADDVVTPQSKLHSGRDLFQHLAFGANGGDPQIRAAHIHPNRVVRHNARG